MPSHPPIAHQPPPSVPSDPLITHRPPPSVSSDPLIAHWQAQARRHVVSVNGCRVCWRAFGSGPALVLLHGGHGSWLHWVRNVEALAGRFTVWVPDLPGYGDSDMPASGALQALLDATSASMEVVVGANTPIDLAGFSFGGLVAAHLAARHGNVGRLVLLGPAGHGGVRRPHGKLLNWQDAARAGDAAALAAVMRHNLAVHMLHDAAAIDPLAVALHTTACMAARFHSKHISRAGGLADALTRHRGEQLLVWGEHDVTAEPALLATRLCEGQVRRHACVVPGAGHWVQYEQARAVNDLLIGAGPQAAPGS